MVVEEIVLIKNVDWHKYYCLLCNINSDVFNGLFIGPEKTHINLMLRKDVALISQQKPVLVVPGKPLDFQDKIMLGGRSFMVNEYDIVSTPGITYYSLMPTTMSKEMIEHHQGETVFIEKYNAPIMRVQDTPVVVGDSGVVQVSPNIPITVRTAEGHFNCSSDMVEVLEYKENEITFIVHFGVNNFSIETKGADNLVITTNYEVVL